MDTSLISSEEKKELFNRIKVVELEVSQFIEVVKDKLEEVILEINKVYGRIEKLEKKE